MKVFPSNVIGILYSILMPLLSIDNKWEIPLKNIRMSTKLGRGEFGCLYDAEIRLSNGQLVRALVKVCVLIYISKIHNHTGLLDI